MAPWRLASQSEADPDESLESELVSSLESLLESILLVEDSLPYELELELELEVEDAVVIEGTECPLFFKTTFQIPTVLEHQVSLLHTHREMHFIHMHMLRIPEFLI